MKLTYPLFHCSATIFVKWRLRENGEDKSVLLSKTTCSAMRRKERNLSVSAEKRRKSVTKRLWCCRSDIVIEGWSIPKMSVVYSTVLKWPLQHDHEMTKARLLALRVPSSRSISLLFLMKDERRKSMRVLRDRNSFQGGSKANYLEIQSQIRKRRRPEEALRVQHLCPCSSYSCNIYALVHRISTTKRSRRQTFRQNKSLCSLSSCVI